MNQADPLLDQINLAYNPALSPVQRLHAARAFQLALALPPPCDKVQAWAEAAQDWLTAPSPHPRWTLSIRDPHYPTSLHALKDPPLIIFGMGEVEILHLPSIAMVGSRNASHHGLQIAQDFAQALGEQGWAIVSGLAEGIDGAAHRGALAGSAPTLGVLGGGLDRLYPKVHLQLADDLLACGGALVSEYPPGTDPQPAFFPRRNRIIAALSDGVLVVEAALKSGSLITARVGSEIGRPVMAIPGSIHSTHSKGCHEMIKKGALLVETAQEVVAEALACLPPSKPRPTTLHRLKGSPTHTNQTKAAKAIKPRTPVGPAADARPKPTPAPTPLCIPGLDAMFVDLLVQVPFHPVTVDELMRTTGTDHETLLGGLTELELDNWVVAEPGNRWQRLR